MKNFFLINPSAGRIKNLDRFIEEIEDAFARTGMEGTFYLTKYKGDSERFIHETCENLEGETVRFFGCGGDGTVNEVINACVQHENAVAGCFPHGTGNDFIRYFDRKEEFLNFECQLEGEIREIDLLRLTYEEDGVEMTRYCDNMINIGFDSNVVELAQRIKRKKFIGGNLAYLMAVLSKLIGMEGTNLCIRADGELVHDGPLLLMAVANAMYCGGGVKSSPHSTVDDGVAELSIIQKVGRIDFFKLYPSYSKGTHLQLKDIEKIVSYTQVKEVEIVCNDGKMRVSNDGELLFLDRLKLTLIPKAVKFSVPRSL